MGVTVQTPLADVGSSVQSFFDAAATFFENLAAVHWGALSLALALNLAQVVFRSRAWFNVLRAAYPRERIRWRGIFGSYMAGVGINSVIPAHVGDVIKIYLAKTRVAASTYPTVASSFFVQSIFDMTVGALVMAFALTQGVFPRLPDFSDIPAFDVSYLATHPKFTVFLITVLALGFLVLFAWLSRKVRAFWARVKQGWAIVTDRRRYLREVFLLQAFGWTCRFLSFYFFLEAFSVDANATNVLLVMSVQSISTAMPLTPGGAGAQQALLAYIFRNKAARATVISFSVGTQLALAICNAIAGFIALFLMMRTFDYKDILRRGEREKEAAASDSP